MDGELWVRWVYANEVKGTPFDARTRRNAQCAITDNVANGHNFVALEVLNTGERFYPETPTREPGKTSQRANDGIARYTVCGRCTSGKTFSAMERYCGNCGGSLDETLPKPERIGSVAKRVRETLVEAGHLVPADELARLLACAEASDELERDEMGWVAWRRTVTGEPA